MPRDQVRNREVEHTEEFRSYIWGIILALALTLAPFGLVYWSVAPHFWLIIAIGGFGFVQMIVHFRFFLHIRPSIRPMTQNTDDFLLVLLSAGLVAAIVGATIWILYNLAMRMM